MKVSLCDEPLLVGDVEASLSQGLDYGVMPQKRPDGRVTLQDVAAGPPVEVGGQEEADHGGLQVLLGVLVQVEGLGQLLRNRI